MDPLPKEVRTQDTTDLVFQRSLYLLNSVHGSLVKTPELMGPPVLTFCVFVGSLEVGLTWLLWAFPDPAARGYTDWP